MIGTATVAVVDADVVAADDDHDFFGGGWSMREYALGMSKVLPAAKMLPWKSPPLRRRTCQKKRLRRRVQKVRMLLFHGASTRS